MTTLERSLDEPVISSSDDGASVKPSHNTRLSIPPLSLPLPHVMHVTNTNANASVTKKNELRSSSEQPLRFLANSVSISVTNSANNQKPVADVSRDVSTESRKKENLMISSSVSCINPHDIQQKQCLLHQGILRRVFGSWRWQTRKHQWKMMSHAKDEQICYLLTKMEQASLKMVHYCLKQRKRRLFRFWRVYNGYRKRKQLLEEKARDFFVVKRQSQVYRLWRRFVFEKSLKYIREMQVEKRCSMHMLSRCVQGWRDATAHQQTIEQHVESKVREAIRKNFVLSFQLWSYESWISRTERRIGEQHVRTISQYVVSLWRHHALESKRLQCMEEIVVNQMSRYVLDGVYFAWKTYCRDQLELRLLKQNIFAMEMIKQLHEDNTRLAKIVDSGVWGDEQINLLHAAAHVLREEKNNLQKVLNQFPWSKDRRLAPSHDCPEVFLRLSKKVSPRTKKVPSETRDSAVHDVIIEHDTNTQSHRPASLKGHLPTIGNTNLATCVTLEALEENKFSWIKRVNESFSSFGFLH